MSENVLTTVAKAFWAVRRTFRSAFVINFFNPSIPYCAMALERNLTHRIDALHVLREHTDATATYLTTNQQTKNRNRRFATLLTVEDFEKTHGIKLKPKDAIDLLTTDLPPLPSPKHPLYRKHFVDRFRYLSKAQQHAYARRLLKLDEDWLAKTDEAKVDRIRKYIKSNYFPHDVNIKDVIHVASREFVPFT